MQIGTFSASEALSTEIGLGSGTLRLPCLPASRPPWFSKRLMGNTDGFWIISGPRVLPETPRMRAWPSVTIPACLFHSVQLTFPVLSQLPAHCPRGPPSSLRSRPPRKSSLVCARYTSRPLPKPWFDVLSAPTVAHGTHLDDEGWFHWRSHQLSSLWYAQDDLIVCPCLLRLIGLPRDRCRGFLSVYGRTV